MRMTDFGFGRPKSGLIQMAFTVPDLREAVGYWTGTMKAGPWFLVENFSGENPLYRGEPCRARIDAALGFAGSMQIELIELANEEPGIHRDAIRAHGYGFHHFGQACADINAERARHEALGYVTIFEARMPSGDMVYYMRPPDFRPDKLVELIGAGPVIDAAFTKMWRSSIGWAGDRPIRPFAELFE
jgi:hypothetical protein